MDDERVRSHHVCPACGRFTEAPAPVLTCEGCGAGPAERALADAAIAPFRGAGVASLREAVGLPLPERRIGEAALDYQLALSAPRGQITRRRSQSTWNASAEKPVPVLACQRRSRRTGPIRSTAKRRRVSIRRPASM